MAQQGNPEHREKLCCSICLDLLKDPVTIPCGHSYCLGCIKRHWDLQGWWGILRCPQCSKTFTSRPELLKNVVLAELVEELTKTQDAPDDCCYAGPEDVACDFCTGPKVKAAMSCLVCLASYCENHLQPHLNVAPLKKHKLVEPCAKLQENICSAHHEVMKMFCRTDRCCICYLCSVEEHKGHDNVSAVAERAEKQKELGEKRLEVQQRVWDGEKRAELLQQEAEFLRGSADRAVDHSDKIFAELIGELQRRSSEVKEQIRSQLEAEESRIKESLERLEQEVAELRRKDAELEQLVMTQDHIRFLQDYVSLPALGLSSGVTAATPPLRCFEDLTAAVSRLRGQILDILAEPATNLSQAGTGAKVLLKKPEPEPEPEPQSRADFLKYWQDIRMDPNTANKHILLSVGNRMATRVKEEQSYSDHPDRFTHWSQVLSKRGLTCRCYWEVEVSGKVHVAVVYKDISRAGDSDESKLGCNDKSWMLVCNKNRLIFFHNNEQTLVSNSGCSRVGVYLDHSAGVLSFYRVTDTMTLITRVKTTFTQPLYPGVCLYHVSEAKFCALK